MITVFYAASWLGLLLFELIPLIKERQKRDIAAVSVLMALAGAALFYMLTDGKFIW